MCMKKLLLSLSMVVLTGTMAFAQYYHLSPAAGNPNNVNQEDTEYPVGGGLPATWTPILEPLNLQERIRCADYSIYFPF